MFEFFSYLDSCMEQCLGPVLNSWLTQIFGGNGTLGRVWFYSMALCISVLFVWGCIRDTKRIVSDLRKRRLSGQK